jgi:hypothetical protein
MFFMQDGDVFERAGASLLPGAGREQLLGQEAGRRLYEEDQRLPRGYQEDGEWIQGEIFFSTFYS